eukprot:Skav223454  [mRNA]  locus=scaffold350:1016166:1016971:+ [translate_table: standard]
MRQSQLLLKRWEDEDHLRVVRCIGCTREGIADGIFSNFVHHCVKNKLVGANQLGHILHDSHHLLGIGRQGMNPPGNVEAHDSASPGSQERR